MMDRIDLNARAFSDSLLDFVNLTDKNHEKTIQKVCFDLYKRIVKRTPWKTGRARGAWGITTGSAPETSPMAIQKPDKHFHFEIEDNVVTIYNNVEYITYLEAGSSKQRPEGMVAVSLAEFDAHFRAATESMKVSY